MKISQNLRYNFSQQKEIFAKSLKGDSMEFLEYLLAFLAVLLLWFKPQKEGLAFGLIVGAIALDFVLWMVASASSWVPGITL